MKLKITLRIMVITVFLLTFAYCSAIPSEYVIDTNALFLVKKEGKYGFINGKGKIVIPCTYKYAKPFCDGLACVNNGEKWGYLNTKGNYQINPQYINATSFFEGYAIVHIDENSFSIIDKMGKVVSFSKETYNYIAWFSENGLCPVKIGEVWGYLDRNFNMVIEPQYCRAGVFSNGLAFVKKKNEEYGYYIDKTGKTVIEGDFYYGCKFEDGIAHVGYEKEMGFIDTKGYVIGRYDLAWGFCEGLGAVKDDGKLFCIDKTGAKVFELDGEYNSLSSYECGRMRFTENKDHKYGFLDKSGKVAIPAIYDCVESFVNGLAWVEDSKNDKMGYIDINGHWVWSTKLNSNDSVLGLR